MYRRDISRFEKRNFYRNWDQFYSDSPQEGLTTIDYGATELDIFHIDRKARTTIVCFHAASRSSAYPLFSALRLTQDLNANILCVSDPVLSLGTNLGWYAGSSTQPLQEDLPRVLRHFLAERQKNDRLVFFGASGGGFASLFYSHSFPGSISIAVNPQMNIAEYQESSVNAYLDSAWEAEDLQSLPVTSNLAPIYQNGFPNTLYILQNVADAHHRDRHLAPWMRVVPAESSHVNLLMDDWGPGHTPPPTQLIQKVLRAVISNDQPGLLSLGFVNAPRRNEPAILYDKWKAS